MYRWSQIMLKFTTYFIYSCVYKIGVYFYGFNSIRALYCFVLLLLNLLKWPTKVRMSCLKMFPLKPQAWFWKWPPRKNCQPSLTGNKQPSSKLNCLAFFAVFIILTPLMMVSGYLSLKLAKHIEKNEKDKKKKCEWYYNVPCLVQ